MLLNAERATGNGVGVKEKNKQTKSTCDHNIYVKKHVYGRKSIGSKPTKNFKKNKEKKKEKHTQSEPKTKFTC